MVIFNNISGHPVCYQSYGQNLNVVSIYFDEFDDQVDITSQVPWKLLSYVISLTPSLDALSIAKPIACDLKLRQLSTGVSSYLDTVHSVGMANTSTPAYAHVSKHLNLLLTRDNALNLFFYGTPPIFTSAVVTMIIDEQLKPDYEDDSYTNPVPLFKGCGCGM